MLFIKCVPIKNYKTGVGREIITNPTMISMGIGKKTPLEICEQVLQHRFLNEIFFAKLVLTKGCILNQKILL